VNPFFQFDFEEWIEVGLVLELGQKMLDERELYEN
tara:strand:+ start:16 stop:120 length:105 start_codon:yes stop_codon:yes gene_type:complete